MRTCPQKQCRTANQAPNKVAHISFSYRLLVKDKEEVEQHWMLLEIQFAVVICCYNSKCDIATKLSRPYVNFGSHHKGLQLHDISPSAPETCSVASTTIVEQLNE